MTRRLPLRTCEVAPWGRVILTEGARCQTMDGHWRTIYGVHSCARNAWSDRADELTLAMVTADKLTEEQRSIAQSNTARMAITTD